MDHDIIAINTMGSMITDTVFAHEISTYNLRETLDSAVDVDLILTAPRVNVSHALNVGGSFSAPTAQFGEVHTSAPAVIDGGLTLGATLMVLATGSEDPDQQSGLRFGYGDTYGSMMFSGSTGQFQFKNAYTTPAGYAPVKVKEIQIQATDVTNVPDATMDFTIRSAYGNLEFVHSVDGVFMMFRPPSGGVGQMNGVSNLVITRPTQFTSPVSMVATTVSGAVNLRGATTANHLTVTGTLDATTSNVLLPASLLTNLTAGLPQVAFTWSLGEDGVASAIENDILIVGSTGAHTRGLCFRQADHTSSLLLHPSYSRFQSTEHVELSSSKAIYENGNTLISRTQVKLGNKDVPGRMYFGGAEYNTWRAGVNATNAFVVEYRTNTGEWVEKFSVDAADEPVALILSDRQYGQASAPLAVYDSSAPIPMTLGNQPVIISGPSLATPVTWNSCFPSPLTVLSPGDTGTYHLVNDVEDSGAVTTCRLRDGTVTVPYGTVTLLAHGLVLDVDTPIVFQPIAPHGTLSLPYAVAATQWGGLYWMHPVAGQALSQIHRGATALVVVQGPYHQRLAAAQVQRYIGEWHVIYTQGTSVVAPSYPLRWDPVLHPYVVETITGDNVDTSFTLTWPITGTIQVYSPNKIVVAPNQYRVVNGTLQFYTAPHAGTYYVAYIPNVVAPPAPTQGVSGIAGLTNTIPWNLPLAPPAASSDTVGVPTWNGQVQPILNVSVNAASLFSVVNTSPGSWWRIAIDQHQFVVVGVDGVPCPATPSPTLFVAFGQRVEGFVVPTGSVAVHDRFPVHMLPFDPTGQSAPLTSTSTLASLTMSSAGITYPFLPVVLATLVYQSVVADSAPNSLLQLSSLYPTPSELPTVDLSLVGAPVIISPPSAATSFITTYSVTQVSATVLTVLIGNTAESKILTGTLCARLQPGMTGQLLSGTTTAIVTIGAVNYAAGSTATVTLTAPVVGSWQQFQVSSSAADPLIVDAVNTPALFKCRKINVLQLQDLTCRCNAVEEWYLVNSAYAAAVMHVPLCRLQIMATVVNSTWANVTDVYRDSIVIPARGTVVVRVWPQQVGASLIMVTATAAQNSGSIDTRAAVDYYCKLVVS